MDIQIVKRFIAPRLLDALKVSPVVFLNGIRQSGKSTLVQSLDTSVGNKAHPADYITFDKPVQMASAAASPENFLRSFPHQVIIDEVQMVPELFRPLKIVVDDLRRRNRASANGKFLLTGSSNILALPQLSDSLAGRMSVLTLYPLSSAEATGGSGSGLDKMLKLDFSGLKNRNISLNEAISKATFPELLYEDKKLWHVWFDGFLITLLQRDIRQMASLEKISILPHLLRILATRAGGLINDADIARDAGLNAVTGKFYRSLLKMMFLNFDIPSWHKNIGKRLVKSSKGYLIDTMLLCHVLGMEIDDMAKNKAELFGHVLENYVATELVKQISYHPAHPSLFHFRTSDGKEVDFIVEQPNGSLFAIEVKKSETVSSADFKGIEIFASLAKKNFKGGIVLYSGNSVAPFGKNLWAVPLSILWQ